MPAYPEFVEVDSAVLRSFLHPKITDKRLQSTETFDKLFPTDIANSLMQTTLACFKKLTGHCCAGSLQHG